VTPVKKHTTNTSDKFLIVPFRDIWVLSRMITKGWALAFGVRFPCGVKASDRNQCATPLCHHRVAQPPAHLQHFPTRPHMRSHILTMSTQELLVDVRSPSEFSTGYLTSDIAPTVNIEYQIIDQLPEIYAAKGIVVGKDDAVTLYCRSGRRSNIALGRLKELGFKRVRDIGGFEEARKVLDREQVQRQLDAEMEKSMGQTAKEAGKEEDPKKHVRVKSFGALVDGLKALEN
jgi:rhodanese-related sulfurtransferase